MKNHIYIIAEAGINHCGNLDIAKDLVKAAAQAGCDAVKFQSFNPDEFIADKSLPITYPDSSGKIIEETQYDFFKRVMMPDDWHYILNDYAKELGIDFLSSAADKYYVDLLLRLNVKYIKLASEDLINLPLLNYLSQKQCNLILSTGMADESEITTALECLNTGNIKSIIILHCVSSYPTPDSEANLKRINTLYSTYNKVTGYSDHTHGDTACLAAVALGAQFIEKHFTLSRKQTGPDHIISLEPEEMKNMVKKIRKIEKMFGDGNLNYQQIEQTSRDDFRRAIVAKRNIDKGELLSENILALQRVKKGLSASYLSLLLTKKAKYPIKQGTPIRLDDLED